MERDSGRARVAARRFDDDPRRLQTGAPFERCRERVRAHRIDRREAMRGVARDLDVEERAIRRDVTRRDALYRERRARRRDVDDGRAPCGGQCVRFGFRASVPSRIGGRRSGGRRCRERVLGRGRDDRPSGQRVRRDDARVRRDDRTALRAANDRPERGRRAVDVALGTTRRDDAARRDGERRADGRPERARQIVGPRIGGCDRFARGTRLERIAALANVRLADARANPLVVAADRCDDRRARPPVAHRHVDEEFDRQYDRIRYVRDDRRRRNAERHEPFARAFDDA
ncbi:MAG: hypothetical protein NVSMB21_21150 [Vulcanimicrobiaceae bacterium]